MRRFILLFIAFCVAWLPNLTAFLSIETNSRQPSDAVTAYAEVPRYGRILTEDAGFYSDKGDNFKFYIPYSYYVKILSIGELYTKVSYGYEDNKYPIITGYVYNEDLRLSEHIPTAPFAVITLTVISDGVLFGNIDLTEQKVGICSGKQVFYYGDAYATNGEDLCYVCCDGYLGYMRTSCFSPFTIKLNPDPIETSESDESIDSGNGSVKPSVFKNDKIQLMIIACVSVVAVSIVYLLFKPQDTRLKNNTQDEDE